MTMRMQSTLAAVLTLVAAVLLLHSFQAQGAPSRPDYASCQPYVLPSFIPHKQEGPVRNCCIPAFMDGPNVYKEWKQYLLENPLPEKPRVRPAAHLIAANSTYLEQLNRAFQLVQSLPKDDMRSNYNMDNYHCMEGGAVLRQKGFPDQIYSVHQNWQFHPFHRWFAFFYERILAKLLGDDTFALPFWQWENQTPKEPFLPNVLPWFVRRPDLFPNLYSASRNPQLAPGQPDLMVQFHADWDWITMSGEEGTLIQDLDVARAVSNANLYELITNAPDAKFLSIPLRAGDVYVDNVYNFENIIHSVIHFFVGDPAKDFEDMGALYSSMHDPMLMIHHANVDRIWAVWQTLGLPNFEDDPDFLDQEFFFYNEHQELVRVTTADCLDIAKLGYTYQEVENPWLNKPDEEQLIQLPSHRLVSTRLRSGAMPQLQAGSKPALKKRPRRHTW